MKMTVTELLETDGAFEALLSRDAGITLHLGVLDAQELNRSRVEALKKKNELFSKAGDAITKKYAKKDENGSPVVSVDPGTGAQSVTIENQAAFNAERDPHDEEYRKFLLGEEDMVVKACIPRELLPDPINGRQLRRLRPFLMEPKLIGPEEAPKKTVTPKKAAKNG